MPGVLRSGALLQHEDELCHHHFHDHVAPVYTATTQAQPSLPSVTTNGERVSRIAQLFENKINPCVLKSGQFRVDFMT
jgi:hypothetical protein